MSKLFADNVDTTALEAMLESEGIALELTTNPGEAAATIRPGDREQCDLETICAGGWIECPAAWALAQKLGISVQAMGAVLERLNVKVRNCGLGCF